MSKRSAELVQLYLSTEPIPLSSEPGPGEPPYHSSRWVERYGWMERYVALSPGPGDSSGEDNALLLGLLELMQSGERDGVRIDPIEAGGPDVLDQIMDLMTQVQIPYITQDIYDDPNVPDDNFLKERDYLVSRRLAVVFNGEETIEEKYQEIAKIALLALTNLQFDHASWIPF